MPRPFYACDPYTPMGFDKDSSLPLIDPQKKTTKVNLLMVLAVIVFLLGSAGVVIWLSQSRHSVPSQGPTPTNP